MRRNGSRCEGSLDDVLSERDGRRLHAASLLAGSRLLASVDAHRGTAAIARRVPRDHTYTVGVPLHGMRHDTCRRTSRFSGCPSITNVRTDGSLTETLTLSGEDPDAWRRGVRRERHSERNRTNAVRRLHDSRVLAVTNQAGRAHAIPNEALRAVRIARGERLATHRPSRSTRMRTSAGAVNAKLSVRRSAARRRSARMQGAWRSPGRRSFTLSGMNFCTEAPKSPAPSPRGCTCRP